MWNATGFHLYMNPVIYRKYQKSYVLLKTYVYFAKNHAHVEGWYVGIMPLIMQTQTFKRPYFVKYRLKANVCKLAKRLLSLKKTYIEESQ